MSYTYNGTEYSVTAPVQSITVNKQNIVITDKTGSQLFKFMNTRDSKSFLAWVYQA
jgi:hypothetical protein